MLYTTQVRPPTHIFNQPTKPTTYPPIQTKHKGLVSTYLRLDERARALIFLVKAWARVHELNEPRFGSLSSYAYSVLVLGYLQLLHLLPVLQHPSLLPPPTHQFIYQGLDVSYCQDLPTALSSIPSPNPSLSLSELLIGTSPPTHPPTHPSTYQLLVPLSLPPTPPSPSLSS